METNRIDDILNEYDFMYHRLLYTDIELANEFKKNYLNDLNGHPLILLLTAQNTCYSETIANAKVLSSTPFNSIR